MAIDDIYRNYAVCPSDINQHLEYMHDLCVEFDVQQVVELGVRSGLSTAAFLAAMDKTDGRVWSCDVSPASCVPEIVHHPRWTFVWGDDIDSVAQAPHCDVLFIDTSHQYEHTRRELDAYAGKVRPGGVILLHDTQLQSPDGTPTVPFPVRTAALEFQAAHPEWAWTEFEHNYGLGVLKHG